MADVSLRLSDEARVEQRLGLCPDCVLAADGNQIGRPAFPSVHVGSDAVAGRLIAALSEPRPREALLGKSVGASGDLTELARAYYWLDRFAAAGLLATTLMLDGNILSTLIFRRAPARAAASPTPAGSRLHRHAMLRPGEDGLVLTAPDGPAELRLGAAALPYIAGLARSRAQAPPATWPAAAVAALRDMLERAGVLATPPCPAEEMWSAHDLALHWRSRAGDWSAPYGAQFPFRGRWPAPPAVKPPFPNPPIALPVPDLKRVAERDPPLTEALERRRSRRVHGGEQISLAQVGEFLFRTARVRSCGLRGDMPVSSRPYPSGGACYELELYLVPSGSSVFTAPIYHYDPLGHTLNALPRASASLGAALVRGAMGAAQLDDPPQLLIVIAARFGRAQWKYSEMTYALTLKHVGVLMQTMYLVAEAMGLSACALGGGSATAFAEATGLNPLEEGSVGEFIVGTRVSPENPAPHRA